MKLIYSIFLTVIILLTIVSFSATQANADSSVNCSQFSLPVTLSAADPTVYHVVGFLCSQGSLQGKTVQFLVHGITYDHDYWDWPSNPQTYSYVRKATDGGYVTFNIDRIGIGLSDHPLSTLVTLESNAYVVHQLVGDLRTGTVGGTAFSKVLLVGHSFGSVTSLFEASSYSDVDGVILSGFAHQLNPAIAATESSVFYPASLDPKFANSNFPGVYLTTIPNTRGSLFYNLSDADPNVIALDEQLKQTVTDGELGTLFDGFVPTLSQAIHVPVLIADGQKDALFCNASLGLPCNSSQDILQRESSDFSSQACLEAFILPNSGHSINLHLNGHVWFEAAIDWANRRIGSSISNPPTQPCQ